MLDQAKTYSATKAAAIMGVSSEKLEEIRLEGHAPPWRYENNKIVYDMEMTNNWTGDYCERSISTLAERGFPVKGRFLIPSQNKHQPQIEVAKDNLEGHEASVQLNKDQIKVLRHLLDQPVPKNGFIGLEISGENNEITLYVTLGKTLNGEEIELQGDTTSEVSKLPTAI